MKRLLRHFVEGDNSDIYIHWFVSSFGAKNFQEMNRLMWHFLHYCSVLGISAERRYLETFLRVDAKSIIFTNNIKLSTMDPFDYADPTSLEEAVRIIKTSAMVWYDEAISDQQELHPFKVDINTWIDEQKKVALMNAIRETTGRFGNGDTTDDLITDMDAELVSIQTAFDKRKIVELDFITRRVATRVVSGESGEGEYLFKWGLECMDGVEGGCYTERLYTVTGLSGMGKTRFAMRFFVYIAAVLYGMSVRVDSQELPRYQIENMLIAMHIVVKFNGAVKIPDSAMNNNQLDEDAMRYYNAAKEDLFNNPAYGKIYIFDSTIMVEEYEKNVISFLRQHPEVKLVTIDYAGYSRSLPNKYGARKNTAEVIEELYRSCKEAIAIAKVSFCIINQYNQDGASKARSGKPISQGDIQGGQTVHKYTLFNLYFTQTEEQMLAGIFIMICDKARFGRPFSNVPIESDLSISRYKQRRRELSS